MTGTHDHPTNPDRPRVAVLLASGLVVVSAFQVALTLGAPFGAAAMGGTNPGRLPDGVRIVTGFSAALWLFAAFVVLAKGGRPVVAFPDGVVRKGPWVLVALLGLGTLMNFASSSRWERFGWGPFTAVLFILALVLARSDSSSQSAHPTIEPA